MTITASAFRTCSYNLRGCAKNDKKLQREKIDLATKYHDIVGMLDTHLNQGEVNVMIKENKTFFQDFHKPLLIPIKTRGIMVLIRKTCPFSLIRHYEVTPNCLSVKMTSASNQELEIAFVYYPNDELDKIRNLKAAVTHLAGNGCTNNMGL